MKLTAFKDLYYTDYNLARFLAVNQKWGNGREFSSRRKPRETSALLYLKDCRIEYLLDNGERLSFGKGSIIYIPQGSEYKSWFYACDSEYAYTQLLEFELLSSDGAPFICCDKVTAVATDDIEYYADLFEDAVSTFHKFSLSYAELKAILYTLLAKISKHHQKENIYSKEFNSIAPAINYLQINPYIDLRITQLADMCHVSESCFRYLFKRYFGMTPTEYCLNNRINRAKQLLLSDMYSIGETAAMLGFSDPGYFSKVFKKATGMSPREYIEKN